jgi:hypothetical protein
MTVTMVFSHEVDGKAVPQTIDVLYANKDDNVLTYVGLKAECVDVLTMDASEKDEG